MSTIDDDLVVILDELEDINKVELGMEVSWIDRKEGAFGFNYNGPTNLTWKKFLWTCRKMLRKVKK
jgi:hypothetical protein